MTKKVEVHPIQRPVFTHERSVAPTVVTMRAYEVYCHVYGEQEALVAGGCRGGFSTGELVCFLYARSFPKEEWKGRFREASDGLVL